MKHCISVATLAIFAFALFLAPSVRAQQDAARPAPQDIGAVPGHLPKVHYIPSDTWRLYPVWVDASMVLNADGSISSLIPKNEGEWSLKPLLTAPRQNGCVPAGGVIQEIVGVPDHRSVEEATKNSRLVVLGKVTEKSFGVNVYLPGQLLRVVPEKTLKGQPRDAPAYFVFMPVGNFKIGSVPICAKDSRYPDAPAVGDEVLLFVPDEPGWETKQSEPYLELLDDGGIVTIHSDSTVSLPARFAKPASPGASVPKSTEDLLARVQAAAGQESR